MNEVKESSPTAELHELTKGTRKSASVTDKSGKEWQILPLDLADVCEFEDKIGISLFDAVETMRVRQIMYLLFLSLRKTGCSPDEIEARKFRWTSETAFMREFNLTAFVAATKILNDLLKISGLGNAEPDRPQKADQ